MVAAIVNQSAGASFGNDAERIAGGGGFDVGATIRPGAPFPDGKHARVPPIGAAAVILAVSAAMART